MKNTNDAGAAVGATENTGNSATQSGADLAKPRDDWVGDALLFFFFLTILGGLLYLNFYPELRVLCLYQKGRCVVLDKRVVEHVGRKGVTYRPEVLIRYEVAGTPHEVWAYDAVHAYNGWKSYSQQLVDQFDVGQEYPCWYHPADPDDAVLVLGFSWLSWILLAAFAVLLGFLWRAIRRHISAT
jgi:hypothetical protein